MNFGKVLRNLNNVTIFRPIVLNANLVRKISPTGFSNRKEYFCKTLNNNAINETLKNSVMGKLEGIQYSVS